MNKVKVALICPSNILYMPYLENYEEILKEYRVDYDVINWDRFNIEDVGSLKFRDLKSGHQRNILDYYKFRKFIKRKLKEHRYDKVIVFGVQLTFFLKDVLRKRFKNNFIIDIRDHNKIVDYFNIENVIAESSCVVISSAGYQKWLPSGGKYVVNHNSRISQISELNKVNLGRSSEDKIRIAFIGAIRDYQINIEFINSLKNSSKVFLNYHGEGSVNQRLLEHLKKNDILNVKLTGRYGKEEEKGLFLNNDFINVLRYSHGINNRTALPNRLYNSTIYGKPMLAYGGSELAKIIGKFKLGIVVDSFEDIENVITEYVNTFDVDVYQEGRISFISQVIDDNLLFKEEVVKFIN